jgi:hypothetical protein
MMKVALQHAWLQKHPSPRSARGDFHWYPEEGDAAARTALAARAGEGGEVLWRIEPGRVTWALSFAEVAPADGRSYVGLAVTTATAESRDTPASALLAAVTPLPPAPWRDQPTRETVDVAALPPHSPAATPVPVETARSLAQGLWRGGAAAVADPAAGDLPRLLASLETWLPPAVREKPRSGTLVGEGNAPSAGPLFHYLGRAWALPAAIAARDPQMGLRAWTAAMGLAARAGVSPEVIFDELEALSRSWNTALELESLLATTGTVRADEIAACDARAPAPIISARDAGRLWSRVIHYWGRGFLAGDGIDRRLGALLARRIVADHLFYLDAPDQPALPLRYLRRLRRESLLTRDARLRLEARVAEEAPEVMRHG